MSENNLQPTGVIKRQIDNDYVQQVNEDNPF